MAYHNTGQFHTGNTGQYEPRVPHGDSRIPYGDNRVPHGDSRIPYGDNRVPHGEIRPSISDNKPMSGDSREPHNDNGPLHGDRQPEPQFGDNRQSHGDNRSHYGDNRPQYGNNKPMSSDNGQLHGDNRPLNEDRQQYGDNRQQYGDNRPQYGDNRPQYGENRPQYGDNRPQYGDNRPQYGDNRPLYGVNRPQYGDNRPQYGDNRPQYGDNRPQYGDNRPQYGDNRPQYGDSKPPFNDSRVQYNDNKGSFSDNKGYLGNDEGHNYGQKISSSNSGNENLSCDIYDRPNRDFLSPKQPGSYNDYPPPEGETFPLATSSYPQNHHIDHGQKNNHRGYPQTLNEPPFCSPAKERFDQQCGNQGYPDRGRGGQMWRRPSRGRCNRGRGNMAFGKGNKLERNEQSFVQMNGSGWVERGRERRKRGKSGNQFMKNMNENDSFAQPTKVAVEGEPHFISYKNSLQEYSQKVFKHVPRYTIVKADAGYSANVEVNGTVYSCQMPQRDKKYAEQGAAFEALKGCGVINVTAVYAQKGNKRTISELKAEPTVVKTIKAQKSISSETPSMKVVTHKCKLNEMCQKLKSSPTYTCEKVDGGFICTVVLDGQVYQSSQVCTSKKLAEQNAAQVVLSQLNVDSVTNTINNVTSDTNVTTATFITPITTMSEAIPSSISSPPPIPLRPPSGRKSMKNQVQEYCQKNGMVVPQYSTIKEAGVCISTVNINGREFVGTPHILKKIAEQNAAKKAFEELGLR